LEFWPRELTNPFRQERQDPHWEFLNAKVAISHASSLPTLSAPVLQVQDLNDQPFGKTLLELFTPARPLSPSLAHLPLLPLKLRLAT
jgi:hypothetical protein